MGGEFAQEREWNHDAAARLAPARRPGHAGVQRLVRDLNRLYRGRARAAPARLPTPEGFRWVVGDDRANSVFAFLRLGDDGDRRCWSSAT